MDKIELELIDSDDTLSLFVDDVPDEALEGVAVSILLSGSSNPGVNCTGGCKK